MTWQVFHNITGFLVGVTVMITLGRELDWEWWRIALNGLVSGYIFCLFYAVAYKVLFTTWYIETREKKE